MSSLTPTAKHVLILIDLLFVAAVTAIGLAGVLPPLDGVLLVTLLGLAAFRGGRSVAFNMVGRPLREALRVFDGYDASGAGDSAHVTGDGIYYVLGNLVNCPICSGTWVAFVLVGVRYLSPSVSDAFIYVLGAAGIAELANWSAQSLEWSAVRDRYDTGGLIRMEARIRQQERQRRELDRMADGDGPFGFEMKLGKKTEE